MWRASTIRGVLVALAMIAAALVLERYMPALTGTVRVADGDSLELGGTRIRLDGIDAPELDQSCGAKDGEWPCGKAARAALRQALRKGQTNKGEVSCRAVDTDRYGRAVSVCEAGGQDLARAMVEQGLAVATGLAYARAEGEARRMRRGIWAGPFEMPADFRARQQ